MIIERDILKETMRRLKICVIIPTYNNEKTLVDIIKNTVEYAPDVIVVNDGSTDQTTEMLHEIESSIMLVTYNDNKGKGYALKMGFKEALRLGFEYAITLDSDGQHYPNDIPLFVQAISENYGALIIGIRDLGSININRKSSFANRFSNFWFMVHTGYMLSDTQTGYRAYPLKDLPPLKLITNRYEAELEMLVLSAWKGVKLIPIPIKVHYPEPGDRVSHFRPAKDFVRISVVNTLFCFMALMYGYPRLLIERIRRKSLFYNEFKPFTLKRDKKRPANITIGRLLRSAYAVSHFLFWSICIFKPYLIVTSKMGWNDRKRNLLRRNMSRMSVFFANNFPGGKTIFENKNNVDFTKPALIICNHQSHLDLPIIMSLTPNIIFLTNDWVWNNKFFGSLVKEAQFLPVSLGMEKLIPKLENFVSQGLSIVVFPEGTRSEDGKVGRFHQGGFAIAEQLDLDIVPMVIHGANDYLPKKEFMLRKNPQILSILGRFDAHSYRTEPIYRRASKFRKMIQTALNELEDSRTPDYYKSNVFYKFAYMGWNTVYRCKRELKNLPNYARLITDLTCDAYFFAPGTGAIPLLCALVNRTIKVKCFIENIKDYDIMATMTELPMNLEIYHSVWFEELSEIKDTDKVFVINDQSMVEYLKCYKPVFIEF